VLLTNCGRTKKADIRADDMFKVIIFNENDFMFIAIDNSLSVGSYWLESMLVLIIACCRWAGSHYLKQFWFIT